MRLRRFLVVWMSMSFHPGWTFSAESSTLSLSRQAIAQSAKLVFAWSPAGNKLAFYRDGNVQTFDLVSGKTRTLTKVGSLSPSCGLSWSPSGAALLLNCPLSLIGIDATSGRSKKLVTSASPIADPQFSPDGHSITFVRDHNLVLMSFTGGPLRPLTTAGNENLLIAEPDPLYGHAFHLDRAYWWAPDSSAIAYLETDRSASGTYPRAGQDLPSLKLKLLTLATGATTEIAAGNADRPYLAGVAWLPDSRRIAYQLLNRLQNQLDLNVYDRATATSRQVMSEKDAYWINLPGAPSFTGNGDNFLLTSETGGYRHIGLYNLAGDKQTDLTPAKTEVRGPLSFDQANQATYFSSLSDNLRDLHLYRVSPDAATPRQITREPGWHQTILNPQATAFVDVSSTADTPPSAIVRRIDGSEIISLFQPPPVDVPKAEFPEIRTHDNLLLPAMLWKPADFNPLKKYPLIVYTFSGPEGRVVKNAWGGWQNAWNRFMTSKGFVVMAVDVRGSGGYGHWFEEYIHYRFGAQETADLREVFSFLTHLPYVDANRIGIWGCDYGAHTVVHAMLEFPHGFAAGFADSPITDWTLYNAYFTERYLGLPARRFHEYHDSSALDNARRLQGKLLVASSPANPFIPKEQMTALQTAMDGARKPFETLSFPDANYRDDPASLAKLMDRMTAFFIASL